MRTLGLCVVWCQSSRAQCGGPMCRESQPCASCIWLQGCRCLKALYKIQFGKYIVRFWYLQWQSTSLKYVSPILIYIPIPKELSNTKPWFQRIIILMQGCKGGWITNYLIYTLSPFRCWEWSISTSWPWSRGWRWWGLGSRGWVGWRWRRGGSRNGGWSCVRTPAHCHSVWNPLVQPWYVILYFMVLCYEILLHDVLKPNMELEKTTTILITCFCEVCSCPTTDW